MRQAEPPEIQSLTCLDNCYEAVDSSLQLPNRFICCACPKVDNLIIRGEPNPADRWRKLVANERSKVEVLP